MKRFFAAILITLCFGVCFASGNMKDICAMLSERPITKGNFIQIKSVKTAKGSRELKSSGEFIFCPQGIMWKTLKPFPSSMIVGNDFIAQISADGNKSVTDTSNNQTFASVAATISAVFSNDYEKLTASFNTELEVRADETTVIKLVPKDSTIAAVISQIDLLIQKNQISGIIMKEASGNSTSHSFENQTYPKLLTQEEQSLFN